MSDTTPLLGQIVEYAGATTRSSIPAGWAMAEGQVLSISGNEALFSLIGCSYGGDCRTTFALPDFRGRTMIGAGATYFAGQTYGAASDALTVANLPDHLHAFTAAVPEPELYAMLGVGLGVLGLASRRRKRCSA